MGLIKIPSWFSFFPNGGQNGKNNRRKKKPNSNSNSDSSNYSFDLGEERLFRFPYKQALTAACLTLTGDTIAQVRGKVVRAKNEDSENDKDLGAIVVSDHDWLRALRMATYGLFLYGPGSYAWYQFLDKSMPQASFFNLSAKVVLNQIVLGPCVIAVIFAWNNLWTGKITQLPSKYQKDALPTLLYGFRFWIPVSVLNFGVVPLSARVAFMSSCSIFWNYYLSTTMSR